MIGPYDVDEVTLVDHAGNIAYAVPAGMSANVQCTDTTMTFVDVNSTSFIRLNSKFERINTMTMSGQYFPDFHECHILSNGNYIILGSENRNVDMSQIVSGGNPRATVAGAVFQERTFTGQTVFEWHSFDHIPVTEATDDVDLLQASIDYIHINSITLDRDGNYLVSCRHLDEVLKINKTTGTVMWKMGGSKSKDNDFTFIDDTFEGFTGFSHQHDVSRTVGGNIMMFDNGNLKPTKYTRVVEYQVDETAKTAKRVWTYRPVPDFYAMAMGSAQELSNGNILIGFGSGATTHIVAQEVTRDGVVQMSMESTDPVNSYRVRKAVFAMSGTERIVSAAGTVAFTHGDSTTRFTALLSSVSAPTSIIAERHSYAPRDASTNDGPCNIMNMRWVVRVADISRVTGSMRFDISDFNIPVPGLLKLYYRAVEGAGKFTQLDAVYEPNLKTLTTPIFRAGEFIIGHPMCFDPVPSLPLNNALDVSSNVLMRWTAAVETGGYDIEVYKGSAAIGTPLLSWHTDAVDTTIQLPEAGTRYIWRVRARRPAEVGPWSSTFSFRSRLGTVVALSPSSLPDSMAIQQHATLVWSKIEGAARYRVRILPLGTSSPALDTLIADTTVKIGRDLAWNTPMYWSVRGELDTIQGSWSNALFIITPPRDPRLLLPAAGAEGISAETASFSWSPAGGAMSYHIRVFKTSVSSPVYAQDTVTSTNFDLNDLSSNTMYHWQVRSISKYGAGPWGAAQWFRTRGHSVLGTSTLLSPLDAVNVDTLDVPLSWTPVAEATTYHVQLTTGSTFITPNFEWTTVHGNTMQCPPLEAGKAYRWRVMALNDIANGPWSTVGQFFTVPGPDDALKPLTPITGSLDVPTHGTVTYVTNARFNEYRIEYAIEPLFSSIQQTATVTTGVAPYQLLQLQAYYWRVIGLKNGVTLDTGITSNFTTGPEPTSVSDVNNASVRYQLLGKTLLVEGALPEGAALQLVDLMGRPIELLENSVGEATPVSAGASTATQMRYDLSHLPTGLYIAMLRTNDSRVAAYSFILPPSP